MPTLADSPLRKVTLNLYESDIEVLKRQYGHGWSVYIRDCIHSEVEGYKAASHSTRTLSDLGDHDG